MKLKCRPEDFRVQERLKVKPGRRGRHSLYRLEKRNWNTLDVIRELEHRHGLNRVARLGLKDRYSLSVQYLSAPGRGPDQVIEKDWRVVRVGMLDRPLGREMLAGNRFAIVLRAMTETEVETVRAAFPGVARFGVANYYDEQRFGSARAGAGFVAERLIAGHWNGALRLWLATPTEHDDSRERKRRRHFEECWGDWPRCLRAATPESRPALEHLSRHPNDPRGAVRLIPRPLLELFLNAWQSWAWNEVLARVVARACPRVVEERHPFGVLRFWEQPTPAALRYLEKLVIPAPAPDARSKSDRVMREMTEVLAGRGLELAGLRLKLRLGGLYFKSWDRAAMVVPRNAELSGPEPDELYPGRSRLTLGFFLPPGSYATIVVKRLMLG